MELLAKNVGNKLVIKLLEKRIDASNAQNLKKELIDFISQGNLNIALDFSEVQFMDSAGLLALLSSLQTLKQQGQGNILLFGVNKKVRKIFSLTNMDQKALFIFNSEEQALKAM